MVSVVNRMLTVAHKYFSNRLHFGYFRHNFGNLTYLKMLIEVYYYLNFSRNYPYREAVKSFVYMKFKYSGLISDMNRYEVVHLQLQLLQQKDIN